ncbi:MAG: diaminopimelate decarboxylase [Candidatus Korarchaeota archaeon]|nr:diaminopimelate decarboxylase [Candidatus Korarchaeota archaeon]
MRVSGIDVRDVVEEFGTPIYLLDMDRIRENFLRLNDALKCPHTIAYAYKANHEPELVRMLSSLGSGATVPSGYGVMLARWAGVPPEKVVLVGPSPSRQDLAEAASYGATVSLESESEARTLRDVGGVDVMVRVNPGLGAGAHPSLVTAGPGTKFGLPPERALSLLRSLRGDMNTRGFHTHVGSQIMSVEPFINALDVLRSLVEQFGGVEVLDLGGGLGISYEGSGEFPLGEYAEIVCEASRELGVHIFVESGRYIVGDAGYLVARVNYVKEIGGRKWVLLDAGMNDLLRPALYGAKHRILVESEGPEEKVLIAGPVCESADFFGEYDLPRVREGDLVVIADVGAYGFSMASRYNLRPLPAVVALEGGRYRLLRERESFGRAIFG